MSPTRFGMPSFARRSATHGAHRVLRISVHTFFLGLLLFTSLLGSGGVSVPALAASHPHTPASPPSLTFQKFLHEGLPDHTYHGPFIRPLHPPLPPG